MAWGNSVFNQNPAYSLYYMHAKQDIVTQGFRKGREKKRRWGNICTKHLIAKTQPEHTCCCFNN